jgi:hypothetical protein
MNRDWNIEKVNRLNELVNDVEGYSESQIAQIMTDEFGEDFSRDSVHNKIYRLDVRSLVDKPVTDIMPYYSKYKSIIESDDTIDKILDIEPDQMVIRLPDRLKILHLGDPHIPFQCDDQIQTAINRNASADIVITTEVMDCYSISRFNKNLSIPFEVEVDNTLRFLETLSEKFPLVLITSGNHDKRIDKAFMKGVPPALLWLVKGSILKLLAKPFANVLVIESPVLQLNDAIFAHAEFFSTTDLKSAINVRDFLNEWKDTLSLDNFRLVVEAHTHMIGSTYRGSMKIMESGCLCKVPDYAIASFYKKPQTNGYLVIVQKDGITDLNLTREFVFPPEKYVLSHSPTGVRFEI